MKKTEESYLQKIKRLIIKRSEEQKDIPSEILEDIIKNIAPGYYQRAIFVLNNSNRIEGNVLFERSPFCVICNSTNVVITTIVSHKEVIESYEYLE
jgi:hypothetical protein